MKMTGLSRGLGSACYAASVLVLGVVVERYAPTAVLPVFAGEMLLLLLLTWRFRASRTMEATAGSGPVLSVGQLLRRYPAYTWLLVGCALLMACHSATCTYMIHIVGKVGGSESMMGSALAVAAFLELPAMGLFSRMRRKVPLAWLLIFCAAFFVIRAGLFWAARSVPVLYLAAALDFFEYGIFIPATVYYVAEHIDPPNQVKGQSLMGMATTGVGSAFGNFVSGQLLDRTGVNGMLLFCTICAAVGLLVVIYAVRKK